MRTYKMPIFSKRHYETIANILGRYYAETPKAAQGTLTAQFLMEFAKDNDLFDEDKFLKALENYTELYK